ncbi:hypothetical protein [Haematomicrobium sanguinis]|uniref:hypothetical protein n=1 Tax=Haematomicrobium sanguinis TaxID=479106 RepID=UPI0012FAB443|nr:hypothetical protein [Haematomicrobium sanguinis]
MATESAPMNSRRAPHRIDWLATLFMTVSLVELILWAAMGWLFLDPTSALEPWALLGVLACGAMSVVSIYFRHRAPVQASCLGIGGSVLSGVLTPLFVFGTMLALQSARYMWLAVAIVIASLLAMSVMPFSSLLTVSFLRPDALTSALSGFGILLVCMAVAVTLRKLREHHAAGTAKGLDTTQNLPFGVRTNAETLASLLHDQVGHRLSLVALRCANGALTSPTAETVQDFEEAGRDTRKAIAELQNIVDRVRMGSIRDDNRAASPEKLVKESQCAGLEVTLSVVSRADVDLVNTPWISEVLRECLTNAHKYAVSAKHDARIEQTRSRVSLRFTSSPVEEITPSRRVGSGLHTLRRQLQQLHGSLWWGYDKSEKCWTVVAFAPITKKLDTERTA